MRVVGRLNDCTACLSADDTYEWAHQAGASWPCSTLSGRRIRVEVADGDLVACALDGRDDAECDGAELDAILSDFGIRQ